MARIFTLRAKNTAIGFDWGTSSVKVVGLRRVGNQYKLSHCFLLEFPIDYSSEQQLQAIKEQLDRSYFQDVPVMVGLPGGSMNIRYVKLPEMSSHDFRNAAIWEVSEQLFYDLSTALIHTELLNVLQDGDLRKAYGLVVAIPRGQLQEEATKFKRLVPKFEGFGIDAFAAATAVMVNTSENPGMIAVLDIGARWSKLVIVKEKKIIGEREIGFGARQINEEMYSITGAEVAEAEVLKRRVRVIRDDGEIQFLCDVKNKELSGEAVKFTLEQLTQELQLSLQFFAAQLRQDIDKVYLTGGATLMKGMEIYFAEKLALPVEVFNPFEEIYVDDKTFRKDEVEARGPQFATAAGLAMNALEGRYGGNFNLLELLEEEKKREKKQGITLRISALSALMFILGVFLFLDWRMQYLKLNNSVLSRHFENFQQNRNKVERALFQTQNIDTRFKALLKMKRQQPHWASLLDDISRRIPSGIWLTDLVVEPQRQVTENIDYSETHSKSAFVLEMRGKALSGQKIRRFYDQMQQSKFCQTVILKKMALEQGKQCSVLDFYIVCSLEKISNSKTQLRSE